MTFLLSEDKALREHLQGMIVHDQKADGGTQPRQVGVWFGQPDQELRNQSYPYVTIDLIDVQRDTEREMRGYVAPDYLTPDGLTENQSWQIEMPIPMTIDYQVTVYSRNPRHDRQLMTQLLQSKLHVRFGALELDDGTVRRLDVLSVTKRDGVEQAKRLFVNAVTVRVSSELALTNYITLQKTLGISVAGPTTTNAGGRPGNPTYIGANTINITQ